MLITSGAIAFVGFTMLPQEWQQTGFILQKSFSWQVIWGSLAAYLIAIMLIQTYLMVVGVFGGWLFARHLRNSAAQTDSRQATNIALGAQAGLMIVTFVMMFF
jgi:hypothetical protein